MNYISVLLKLFLGTVMLIVYARLGGRSQVNPLSGTEVVSSMVVGAMISGSLFDDAVPVWAVAAAIAVWSIFFISLRKVKASKSNVEKIIDGSNVTLLTNGHLSKENFQKMNLSLRDFQVLLQQEGIHSLEELAEVKYDKNGKLTILRKGETPYALILIDRGEIIEEHLTKVKKSKAWLHEELQKQGKELEQVFYAEWFQDQLYLYE